MAVDTTDEAMAPTKPSHKMAAVSDRVAEGKKEILDSTSRLQKRPTAVDFGFSAAVKGG